MGTLKGRWSKKRGNSALLWRVSLLSLCILVYRYYLRRKLPPGFRLRVSLCCIVYCAFRVLLWCKMNRWRQPLAFTRHIVPALTQIDAATDLRSDVLSDFESDSEVEAEIEAVMARAETDTYEKQERDGVVSNNVLSDKGRESEEGEEDPHGDLNYDDNDIDVNSYTDEDGTANKFSEKEERESEQLGSFRVKRKGLDARNASKGQQKAMKWRLNCLPDDFDPQLRKELERKVKLVMRRIQYALSLSEDDVRFIFTKMEHKFNPKGRRLFSSGDPTDDGLLLIVSGQLGIYGDVHTKGQGELEQRTGECGNIAPAEHQVASHKPRKVLSTEKAKKLELDARCAEADNRDHRHVVDARMQGGDGVEDDDGGEIDEEREETQSAKDGAEGQQEFKGKEQPEKLSRKRKQENRFNTGISTSSSSSSPSTSTAASTVATKTAASTTATTAVPTKPSDASSSQSVGRRPLPPLGPLLLLFKSGDTVGENDLLSGPSATRTVHCIALEDTITLGFSRDLFDFCVFAFPHTFATFVLNTTVKQWEVAHRVLAEKFSIPDLPTLESNESFFDFTDDDDEISFSLSNYETAMKLQPGQILFSKDAPAEQFYVVTEGKIHIFEEEGEDVGQEEGQAKIEQGQHHENEEESETVHKNYEDVDTSIAQVAAGGEEFNAEEVDSTFPTLNVDREHGPGSLIGWLDCVRGQRRSFTATAAACSTVIVIPFRYYKDMLEKKGLSPTHHKSRHSFCSSDSLLNADRTILENSPFSMRVSSDIPLPSGVFSSPSSAASEEVEEDDDPDPNDFYIGEVNTNRNSGPNRLPAGETTPLTLKRTVPASLGETDKKVRFPLMHNAFGKQDAYSWVPSLLSLEEKRRERAIVAVLLVAARQMSRLLRVFLGSGLQRVWINAGDILFERGGPPTHIYIVTAGRIRLIRHETPIRQQQQERPTQQQQQQSRSLSSNGTSDSHTESTHHLHSGAHSNIVGTSRQGDSGGEVALDKNSSPNDFIQRLRRSNSVKYDSLRSLPSGQFDTASENEPINRHQSSTAARHHHQPLQEQQRKSMLKTFWKALGGNNSNAAFASSRTSERPLNSTEYDNMVVVGEFGRGETIGEMNVIGNRRHDVTAYAIRDSELVKVSEECFHYICAKYPPVLQWFTEVLATKLYARISERNSSFGSASSASSVFPSSPRSTSSSSPSSSSLSPIPDSASSKDSSSLASPSATSFAPSTMAVSPSDASPAFTSDSSFAPTVTTSSFRLNRGQTSLRVHPDQEHDGASLDHAIIGSRPGEQTGKPPPPSSSSSLSVTTSSFIGEAAKAFCPSWLDTTRRLYTKGKYKLSDDMHRRSFYGARRRKSWNLSSSASQGQLGSFRPSTRSSTADPSDKLQKNGAASGGGGVETGTRRRHRTRREDRQIDGSLVDSPASSVKRKRNLAVITLISAGSVPVDLSLVGTRLREELERVGPVFYCDPKVVNRKWGEGTVSRCRHSSTRAILRSWLHRREEMSRFSILVAENEPTPWTKLCVRMADCLLHIGDGKGSSMLSSTERWLFRDGYVLCTSELVLLHSHRHRLPRGTRFWLRRRMVSHHHHIHFQHSKRDGKTSDEVSRLARHLSGESVGVVLGGGGARGMAHYGALQALEDLSLPIDTVGGTSQGSLIGAIFALMKTTDRMAALLEAFSRQLGDTWNQMYDVTLPIVSYFSGEALMTLLKETFGDARIEDLWIPYFAVSTSVTRSSMYVHQTGLVWKAVCASMTIAAMLPPLLINGELHVDGGYINNLPVDVMAEAYHAPGLMVAVDVENKSTGVRPLPDDSWDSLSGWWVLLNFALSKLGLCNRIPVPWVPDLMLRLSYITTTTRMRELLENTSKSLPLIYIRPRIQRYTLLEFDKQAEIARIGYHSTMLASSRWKGETRRRFALLRRSSSIRQENLIRKVKSHYALSRALSAATMLNPGTSGRERSSSISPTPSPKNSPRLRGKEAKGFCDSSKAEAQDALSRTPKLAQLTRSISDLP